MSPRGIGSFFRSGLLALSICAFVAGAILPRAQAQTIAETPEYAAVARYLGSGGRTPGWALLPAYGMLLASEAAAHGVTLPAEVSGPGAPSEEATMVAALRLAKTLTAGTVLPNSVQRSWTIPVPAFDADAALRTLASLEDPLPWLRSLAPQHEPYLRLQQSLARYRVIAEQGGWPFLADGPALKLRAAGPRVAILQSRLKVEGDLPPDAPIDAVFDALTEQAVQRFQARHGLGVDGRVGRDTWAALNVGALARYQQIAANLERWRWLPHRLPSTRIVVNAAAAELSLIEDDKPVLALRTIVGTKQHPTPVLAATVISLLFNPPWDIPTSIAAKEIRPHARRDPAYLQREGIIARDGGRLRQLPGPKNALGRLKFEMPNPLDVYLHDTPSRDLFARIPRLFSHGCIRLEHPQDLALQLLHRDGQWTSVAIDSAIAAGTTRRVPIAPVIPIYVIYLTAVANADGTTALYDDAYRRDAPLIAALSEQAATGPKIDPRLSAITATKERACQRSPATEPPKPRPASSRSASPT
jgi:L,D-transpeptidase YcbB